MNASGLFIVCGITVFCWGVWMVYPPLSLMIAGGYMIAVGYELYKVNKGDKSEAVND